MIPVQNVHFYERAILVQIVLQNIGAMWCIVPIFCNAIWSKIDVQRNEVILHWNHICLVKEIIVEKSNPMV